MVNRMNLDLPGRLPLLSEALVSKLEELFPDRCPDPAASERAIWMHVGNVEVIRLLRHELDNQVSRSLET
jgi:hypothetical protein